MASRRSVLGIVVGTAVAAPIVHVCSRARDEPIETNPIERGVRFIISQQDKDGMWRSNRHAPLRDGTTLTPMMCKLLAFAPSTPTVIRARYHADRALLEMSNALEDESGSYLAYPVYTAAMATIALARSKHRMAPEAMRRWVSLLRRHQLTQSLGWSEGDRDFGGWGYASTPLQRPADAHLSSLPFSADISSTLFASGALRMAGLGVRDPAVTRALQFARACQNQSSESDPRFDDGGFCFAPTRAFQNKAGVAGTDATGRERYRSYGSATCDGLRAMLRCTDDARDPGIAAALAWLHEHAVFDRNPGDFPEARFADQAGTWLYYLWTLAHAMRAVEHAGLEPLPGWRDSVRETLLSAQHPDGSWSTQATMAMEDDPLVGTGLALGALAMTEHPIGRPGSDRPARTASHDV